MAGRLAGKVAIITGASRGLGQYCSVAYAHEGATVVVAARSETQTDPQLPGTIYETAKMVEEAGGRALPVVCNVADPASIDAMVGKVLETYGRIDILMTNAAISAPGNISNMQPRHFELEFRVNVFGPFHCIRAVLPTMIAQGFGNIITVSSSAANAGNESHYGAGKRAIEALTVGLAQEQHANGIAVNCLKPDGGISTPGINYIISRPEGPPDRPAEDFDFPSPANYVEAAVLLAMQTPDSCTGGVFHDSEAVARLSVPSA
jgi:NAD(P)-dependent dehydrogenase (short-subunit alcohol dehydrogenase family)